MRVLAVGLVAALVVAVAAMGREALGLSSAWPLLVGLAVAMAPRGPARGPAATHAVRLGAALTGVLVGWLALAVRMGLLAPQLPVSEAIVLGGALLLLAVLALPLGLDVLWPAILGIAVFHGVYEPILAADPAGFLQTSPPAVVTSMLVLALGAAAAALGREAAALLTGTPAEAPDRVGDRSVADMGSEG